VIADSLGNIKSESDFYPWGGELQFVAHDSNHYKFTGKERDAETQLDYFGARYFDNPFGRFMTPDPLMLQKQKLFDPQQWNMYQYARNNPLRFTDPTGKYVCQGSKTNCATVHAALDLAKTAASKLPEGSKERQALEKSISAYGQEGKANGVVVTFGKNPAGDLMSTTKDGKTTTVKIDMKQALSGVQNASSPAAEYTGLTVHEGTHVATYKERGEPQNRQQEKQHEREAYFSQAAVHMGLGTHSYYWNPDGDRGQAIAERDRRVEIMAGDSTQEWCRTGGNCH